MKTASFPVYSLHEDKLGSVTVKRNGQGNSIWPVVQDFAAKKLKLQKSEVIILGIKGNDGESLDMENASKKTVKELSEKEAVVHVAVPENAESLTCENTALKEQVASLKMEVDGMKTAVLLQKKLALRQLLDNVRELLAGRQLRTDERGEEWNAQLEQMQDFKGLGRDAALLTKFGRGTQQWQSSQAAHTVDVSVIAHAVTAAAPKQAALYRELFTFAYKLDADDVVFEALSED